MRRRHVSLHLTFIMLPKYDDIKHLTSLHLTSFRLTSAHFTSHLFQLWVRREEQRAARVLATEACTAAATTACNIVAKSVSGGAKRTDAEIES